METLFNVYHRYQGESDVQVQKRMCDTLSGIMEQKYRDNVLAISHGGAIFMFLRAWAEEPIVKRIAFRNCCILKFSYEDEHLKDS